MVISKFKYSGKIYWSLMITDYGDFYDNETPLKKYLLENIAPDEIYVLLPVKDFEGNVPFERIPNNTSIRKHFYYVTKEGAFLNNETNISIDHNIYNAIKNSFFELVFDSHECILNSSINSYYCLPSGYFSTHFIRIGNMLTDGDDIYCLSVFLIPYLLKRPTLIFCDSPSIFPLIYGAIHLYNKLNTSSFYSPLIRTFSFHSITSIDKSNNSSSIYFLSASIIGLLPQKLNSIGIDWSRIIVISNFNRSINNYEIIKDFSKLNLKNLSDFECLPQEDFIKKFPHKKFAIKFETDHFIPSPPKISTILISKDDAPPSLSSLIQRYFETNFIACYYGKNSKGNTRDLYFDIKKMLRSFNESSPNHFEKKTAKLLLNFLPININKIIYIDDYESLYIANSLKDYYSHTYSKDVEIKHFSEINSLDNNIPVAYIVCASCISEGKKIFNVSRLLRNCDKSQIVYFTGIVRCKDSDSLKELKSNLKYGDYGFNTYQFISIEELFLPNEDSETISWELEKNFLVELLFGFNEFNVQEILTEEVKIYFTKRFNDLQNGNLINNVFLKKNEDQSLKLNKNFAFFDFYEWNPNSVSQAIVYFAITSVLHNYRNKNRIKQTVYERFLLKPENFNRFNDGIIQAAFLRSCTSFELNYVEDEKNSRLMSEIINHSINDSDNLDSAPYEFLMAICIGKLRLINKDLSNLVLRHQENMDPIIKVFINVIKNKYLI